jgi:hypothetical protein
MINKVKEIINNFNNKNEYKTLSEIYKKESDEWEFKFNKLNGQLKAILKESDR